MYGMPNFPSQFIGPGPSVGCTPTVSINEGIAPSAVRVYPNPCQVGATFDFQTEAGHSYNLALYDMVGRCVRSYEGISAPFRIDRGTLGGGIYAYLLRAGDAVIGKGKLRIE